MNLSRTLRRRVLVAASLLAVFSLVGFVILPPIVKSQLEQRASAALGRRVSVEKVRLNPYALSLTLENFAIQEADGKTRFLGWRRLYVNFDALSSLWGEWVLSEVALDGFYARGVLNADRSLNVSDLLARLASPSAAPAKPAEPGRPLRVGHLQVTDARVDASDLTHAQPFTTTVGPLTFDLTGFRTVGQRGAPYRFEAVTEAGEKLAWSGTLRAEPFQSLGELKVENLVLAKYAPYYADFVRAEIPQGRLSVRGKYELDFTPGKEAMQLHAGVVQLRDLVVREAGNEVKVIELPAVDVTGIEADARALKATVASVAVNGGHLRVRRAKDGALNVLAMLQPTAATPAKPANPVAVAPAPAATTAMPAKLPDVTVADVLVKEMQVEVEDLAAARPAHLAVNGLQVALQNVSLAPEKRIPLQVSFGWAPAGAVRLAGTVGLLPTVSADLTLDVDQFALLPLSPYLEPFANVHLASGNLSAKLAVAASLPANAAPVANVTGDIQVEKLGLVDGERDQELAGFAGFTLRGLKAATAPTLSVALEEIAIDAPYARAVVAEDGAVNLVAAAKVAPAAAPTGASAKPAAAVATSAATPATAPTIEIGRIVIRDGDFSFADHSVHPGVAMAVQKFGGTINGLSSTTPTKGDVDLKAVVDGVGPVAIAGRLDPLGAKPSVDLKIDVKNVDLQPLSPYSGKFAGYELARGKLQVDVKLLVDGKKVDAKNVITLNQFTFGAPVASPDATKLPVRLAIALLKDLDGKIVIDVPVQGSTDDPSFRVGKVVLRVVVNLLTKAAVSPFSLLGAAFGGGGDELAFQEFAPGAAELQPAEIKKLETMTKALTNRPGLSLDLEGSFDAAADAYALKRLKLADRVRRAVWEQKRQTDPNIAPPDQLVVTPDEQAAAIKRLFDAAFPPGTQFGTPLPAAPAVVAPPPPPPAGWFKRFVNTVTFAQRRAERKAAAESAHRAAEHQEAVAAAVAKGLPTDEMAGRLAEATPITDDELRALAQARAQKVRTYFIEVGKIAPDRLFLAKAKTGSAAAGAAGKGPRVFLHLQ
ncbi:DUF748 domain-containing protein [Opitutus sp. ER46]|uniref:DUF748 domain-containing protein n=1 Tax=Opitutus sp. ER46 TaxID=2161864 RepID=UPI000D2FAB0B|nr:DUF748 domain-containing protein [Opitutus sp. ER46]PTX91692.1 hypothetical protein DB354_17660 [Opitutus sp. ER46]